MDLPKAVAEDAVASVKTMRTGCRRRLHLGALPRCGGSHRSAIAAVSPDGSSNWMAAEELGFCSVRRPDANDKQPLTTATKRIWCRTPPGMLS